MPLESYLKAVKGLKHAQLLLKKSFSLFRQVEEHVVSFEL